MAHRSSVALFLATAGLLSGAGAWSSPAESLISPGAGRGLESQARQLAQASECVPIGEGENCENPSQRRRLQAKPASRPPVDAVIKEEEQDLNQGDL